MFDDEIDAWMRPDLVVSGGPFDPDRVMAQLSRDIPGADRLIIALPDDRRPYASVGWFGDDGFRLRLIDPATGADLHARETAGGDFFFRFHYRLYTPGAIGKWVVGVAAMAMLVAMLAGVLIHLRIFKDIFTFRPWASPRRAWLDGHLLLAVLFLPFHVMITYTGLAILYDTYMPAAIDQLYDGRRGAYLAALYPEGPLPDRPAAGVAAPLAPLGPMLDTFRRPDGGPGVRLLIVDHPGDAAALVHVHDAWDRRLTRDADIASFDGVSGALIGERRTRRPAHAVQAAMIGLHRVSFADPVIRWLYVAGGAAGSAMIATGLVLFTGRRPTEVSRFPAVAARINTGTVAGLLLACIAYLWGNRLLPVAMEMRSLAEVAVFLAVWLLAILHGLMVRPAVGWTTQLGLAAALCLLLPVLDLISTGGQAGAALGRGDAVTIGVHLSAIGSGIGFGWIARTVCRRGFRS